MSFLDIILGALLVFALYKGTVNGLFIELASFLSLIVGVYLAVKFSVVTKDVLAGFVHWNPNTVQVIAFLLTFILVVIGIHFLAKILTGIVDFAFLGWANKLGGGLFRVLKTVLLIGIVFSLFEKINYNHFFAKQETLDKSIFYNPIQKTATFMYPSITKWYGDLKK
ncbi:membrane protein required for colicin V production [Flavobacterium flevense]|uniref:Colicin V production protein n=1 Tax=Flavobacterium flevense TaxID=983 RepID=A0A4Y4AYW9_9FLAO|nr:CvpA family protein [Flavobacterium flevense]GEC71613.1 colicin V production protein [Flavobacterium flevense]SHL48699.1 membrane protein required for colicin V production [Flavobacterium flevense]